MENDKQIVSIGLDFDAREFMQFLEDEAVNSYRTGYEAGKRAERERRRIFWLKVRQEVQIWLLSALVGSALALFFAWVSR